MYEEIKALDVYCNIIGVNVRLTEFLGYGGYVLWFNNGSYCLQHSFSCGSGNKKVEFGNTGSRLDYKATTLYNAKEFIRKNIDKLNKEEIK